MLLLGGGARRARPALGLQGAQLSWMSCVGREQERGSHATALLGWNPRQRWLCGSCCRNGRSGDLVVQSRGTEGLRLRKGLGFGATWRWGRPTGCSAAWVKQSPLPPSLPAVTHERVPEWVEFVALWLPTGSGFLNCFVYFWTNRSFRHKFQKAGQQLCCQARQEQHGHPRPPRLGAAAVGGAGTRPGSSCSGSSSLSLGCSQSPQPPLMALPGSSRALREVTLQGHAHRRGISAACNPQAGVDYGSGV